MTKKNKTKTTVPRIIVRDYPNVTQVVDARSPIAITVVDADGKKGKRGDPTGCAMARAICREYGATGAIIGVGYSYVINGNKAIRYKTNESVAREIVSFDRHDDFQPGHYALAAPSPSGRLGVDKRTGKPSGPNSGVHRPVRHIRGGSMGVRDLRGKQ